MNRDSCGGLRAGGGGVDDGRGNSIEFLTWTANWPHAPRQRLVLGEEPRSTRQFGCPAMCVRTEAFLVNGSLHSKRLSSSSTFPSTQSVQKATPRSSMWCGSLVQPSEAE